MKLAFLKAVRSNKLSYLITFQFRRHNYLSIYLAYLSFCKALFLKKFGLVFNLAHLVIENCIVIMQKCHKYHPSKLERKVPLQTLDNKCIIRLILQLVLSSCLQQQFTCTRTFSSSARLPIPSTRAAGAPPKGSTITNGSISGSCGMTFDMRCDVFVQFQQLQYKH